MGYYLNPTTGTKEQWLQANGIEILAPSALSAIADDKAIVCLADNVMFTAAGIMFSEAELREWKRSDGRSKAWYLVDKAALCEASGCDASIFRSERS